MRRNIYLIRHGEPEHGIGGKKCIGITDLPLSEYGNRQAEQVGNWIAGQREKNRKEPGKELEKELKQCRLYCSPLSRCVETARRIQACCPEMSELQIREDLREMSMGIWENRTFEEIRKRDSERFEERGKNLGYYVIPGGESFAQAGERFEKCLMSILSEWEGDAVVVAHAGVIRGYLCRILNRSANDVMEFPQPYGGITVLRETVGSGGLPEEFADSLSGNLTVIQVGWKPQEWLTEDEIRRIYQSCKTPEHVIRHMEKVAEFLQEIKAQFSPEQQSTYDWELLRKAALLHDIKRLEKHHEKAGAEFLIKQGYPELAALIRNHHGGEWEEKELTMEDLLYYADKRVAEDRIVSVEERFARSRGKCRTEEAVMKHERLFEKAMKIEEKLSLK